MEFFRTENIVKKFANHLALDNVSISVSEAKIFGLLGPNGAGKTTLIRIINQITAPDEGSVFLKGERLKSKHIEQIGYLPEERGLYKKMKVGEQAVYLAQLKGVSKKEALKKLKYWFEKFEIQAWWGKKVEELSKGMQQKIQFVATILHEPKLLIFDEPFSGFDPINTNLLKKEILELRDKGATIIFSTHNMSSVEEICDDITLIDNSRTILEGPIQEIKQSYKTNIYEVSITGNFNKININPNFEILETTQDKNIHSAKIKLPDKSTTNELLASIMSSANIISFNEVIPSMNDIFIKVVGENANSLKYS